MAFQDKSIFLVIFDKKWTHGAGRRRTPKISRPAGQDFGPANMGGGGGRAGKILGWGGGWEGKSEDSFWRRDLSALGPFGADANFCFCFFFPLQSRFFLRIQIYIYIYICIFAVDCKSKTCFATIPRFGTSNALVWMRDSHRGNWNTNVESCTQVDTSGVQPTLLQVNMERPSSKTKLLTLCVWGTRESREDMLVFGVVCMFMFC